MIKLKNYTSRPNREKEITPTFLVNSLKIYPAFCFIVKPENITPLINQLLQEIDTELKYINIVIENLRQSLINLNILYVTGLKEQLILEQKRLVSLKKTLDPCSQSVSEVDSIKSQITLKKSTITTLEQLVVDYENMDVLTTEGQILLENTLVEIQTLKDTVNVKIRRVNELGDLNISEV